MKILNAICFQTFGGVEQVFYDYGEVLQGRGHEVVWLVSDKYLNRYRGGKILKLKNIAPVFDFFHILLIVFKFRPDVIFCHSSRLMKFMRFLNFFSLTKTIGVNHGATTKHARNCNYAINVNAQLNKILIESGFNCERSFVVKNAVQVNEKYQTKKIKTPVVIGIYGRIEWEKGFDVFINAASELDKKNIDFRLKIGGFEVANSITLQDLKDLAQQRSILEKCQFVGLVKDKKEFFSDVDLLVVPSYHESFGMAILEGFLFSTLVISSTTDGGKFLIKDGENGLLFENKNHHDLAAKIEYILQNPQLYNNMTQKAFLRLEKEFSFDFLGDELEKVLQITTKN